MVDAWYFAKNDQQHGPVSRRRLEAMIVTGELAPTDYIWREGMADWAPAQNVLGSLAAAKDVTPPVPPPVSPAAPPARAAPAHSPSAVRRPRHVAPSPVGQQIKLLWAAIGLLAVLVAAFVIWTLRTPSPTGGPKRFGQSAAASTSKRTKSHLTLSKPPGNANRSRSTPPSTTRPSPTPKPTLSEQNEAQNAIGPFPKAQNRLGPAAQPASIESPSSEESLPTSKLPPREDISPPSADQPPPAADLQKPLQKPSQQKQPNPFSQTRTLYQLVTISRQATFNLLGAETPQQMEYRVLSRLYLKERSEGGDAAVQQTILDTRLDRCDDLSRSAMESSLRALVGQEYTLKLNRFQEVIELTGYKNPLKTNPIEWLKGKGFSMASAIDKDGWRELAQITFFQPEPPLKPGQRWNRQMTHDWGPLGRWEGLTQYAYGGSSAAIRSAQRNSRGARRRPAPVTSDTHRIDFAHQMKYVPPTKTSIGLPFRITGAEFTLIQATGAILYDAKRGRVVTATERFHAKGAIDAGVLGQSAKVQMEERQLLSIQIADQNQWRSQSSTP